MGFEIAGISYDPTRKLTRIQKFKQVKSGKEGKVLDFNYTPVPYNISYNLFSFTASAEAGLQIIEQILPFFQPDFTVTINAIPTLNIKIDIPIISMAKGEERNAGREILIHDKFTHRLNENNPLLHFLKNIRDEVHRFAITTHRSKRTKMSVRSVFDDIEGVGPERKKILKKHFGTVEKLKLASLDELKEVKSIPESILTKIYEYFHRNSKQISHFK